MFFAKSEIVSVACFFVDTNNILPPDEIHLCISDNAAFVLGKGAVSKVVETKLGYEIIKVWDKKAERQRPFEEVSNNIKNSLLARKRNEKRREVLRELKGGAEVEQFIKFRRAILYSIHYLDIRKFRHI